MIIQSEDYTEIIMDAFCQEKKKNYECMEKSLATSKDRKDDQLLLQRLRIISRNKIIVPRIFPHDM